MRRSVRILLSLIAAIALAICVWCILFIIQYIRGHGINAELNEIAVSLSPVEMEPEPDILETDPQPYVGPDASSPDPDALPSVENIVNFDELQALNPDIYAWIEIPSLHISHAVLQSPDNDDFYLRHAATGAYYSGGSIFSQRYNSKSFEDPMTILYGHNYKNMFGPLNRLTDADAFKSCDIVRIYTPERVFEYTVFAAHPYSNRHLLFVCDFSDPAAFEDFFASLDDMPGGNFRRDRFPKPGDRVLTLSTCIVGNRMRRFLVQGVLTAEYQVLSPSD